MDFKNWSQHSVDAILSADQRGRPPDFPAYLKGAKCNGIVWVL